jgi:hypothetical protein
VRDICICIEREREEKEWDREKVRRETARKIK